METAPITCTAYRTELTECEACGSPLLHLGPEAVHSWAADGPLPGTGEFLAFRVTGDANGATACGPCMDHATLPDPDGYGQAVLALDGWMSTLPDPLDAVDGLALVQMVTEEARYAAADGWDAYYPSGVVVSTDAVTVTFPDGSAARFFRDRELMHHGKDLTGPYLLLSPREWDAVQSADPHDWTWSRVTREDWAHLHNDRVKRGLGGANGVYWAMPCTAEGCDRFTPARYRDMAMPEDAYYCPSCYADHVAEVDA